MAAFNSARQWLPAETLAYDFWLGLLVGVAGIIVVAFYYSQRWVALAHQRAEQMAHERFILMQSQLEQAIRQTYEARLAQWRQTELVAAVHAARQNALQQSRVTLKGKIGEQLAPLLPEFFTKFDPADARFLGSPIDYVVFRNLSRVESGATDEKVEVYLIDVKTGDAKLTPAERLVKDAVERGDMKFMTMRLPEVQPPPIEPENAEEPPAAADGGGRES